MIGYGCTDCVSDWRFENGAISDYGRKRLLGYQREGLNLDLHIIRIARPRNPAALLMNHHAHAASSSEVRS
jgi:hypothetical protein